MQNVLKVLGLVVKGLSLLSGLAAYQGMLPEKWMGISVVVFGVSSVLKDAAIHIGDYLDDQKENQSFK